MRAGQSCESRRVPWSRQAGTVVFNVNENKLARSAACRPLHGGVMGDRPVRAVPLPAGHADIRHNNLAVVLRVLAVHGAGSRAGIAARTGLGPSTVSRLVGELIELGLVQEAGTDHTRRAGRPATLLEFDGRHVLALGAEINVDYLAVVGTDLANRTVYEAQVAFDAVAAGPDRSAAALARLCRQAITAVASRPQPRPLVVSGLAVAVPGLVDAASGVVTEAPNLHWRQVPFGAALSTQPGLAGVDITVANDANLGALAEYRIGAWAGTPNLVYVTGEVGIGGGIIVGGQPLLGARGRGGEIGHMNLDPAGPPCGCGRRGCWEALIGLGALLRAAGTRPLASPGGTGPMAPETKAASIAARARGGDERILAAFRELGHWVGTGCANLVNIFDPQVIILGGFFRQIAEWILPPARASLEAGVLAPGAGGCELAISSLGFTAAARGGALHVADQVLANPARPAGAAEDVLRRG